MESIPSCHLRLVHDQYDPTTHTSTVHACGNIGHDLQSTHEYPEVVNCQNTIVSSTVKLQLTKKFCKKNHSLDKTINKT